MDRYVIKREDRPGQMLMGLILGRTNTPDMWTKYPKHAIHFSDEEAIATIEFITNVMNEYLGEQLYIEKLKN